MRLLCRPLRAVTLACTAVTALALTPAVAGAATTAPVSVTLALTPSRPAALARLAVTAAPDRVQRLRELAGVAPSSRARDLVTQWASGHGLRAAPEGVWAMTVTGPTATVRSLFSGDTPPAALASVVTAVTGLRTVRYHHSATTLTSRSIRDAYGVPSGSLGSGATIATVQFTGWSALANPSHGDLAAFASALGVPVPPIDVVGVNGAAIDKSDFPGDDFEVAMDQEAVLGTAPSARQRVYVTTNDERGQLLVWQQLVRDVQSGVPVTAVSTSWGACEQEVGASEAKAIDYQLQLLNALGVTVFAASGDTSVYDCTPGGPWEHVPSVDFPASSPHVVGVGGTTLTQNSDGTYTETAWGGGTDPTTGQWDGDGSGGGASVVFARPSWQSTLTVSSSPHRLVPDISSVADTASGAGVYWDGQWYVGGGTSLGAPVQAGTFVSTLAGLGRTVGIGDLHPLLYGNPDAFRDVTVGSNHVNSAGPGYDLVTGLGSPQWRAVLGRTLLVATPRAVRTTTVPISALHLPDNVTAQGWAAGERGQVSCSTPATPGVPTAVTLPAGSDRATAVEVVVHTSDGRCLGGDSPVVLDRQAPRPTAALTLGPATKATLDQVRVSWAANDPAPSSGTSTFGLLLVRENDHRTVWQTTRVGAGSALVPVSANRPYRLYVRAIDAAGNASGVAHSAALFVPYDDAVMSRSTYWVRPVNSAAYGGSYLASDRAGVWASRRVTASHVSVLVTRTPLTGYLDVYVDGRRVDRLDLYSATRRWQELVPAVSFSSTQTHIVTFKVVGAHRAGASGSYVYLDGLYYS